MIAELGDADTEVLIAGSRGAAERITLARSCRALFATF